MLSRPIRKLMSVVKDVDLINYGRTKMFDTIGKPTYLLPEVVVKLTID